MGIDYIGPLSPESQDGCKYILNSSDYFTKWVEAVHTKENKAVTFAFVLYKLNSVIYTKDVFRYNTNVVHFNTRAPQY